ncbi:hypothetical protein D9M71_560010 [compost metagenome]
MAAVQQFLPVAGVAGIQRRRQDCIVGQRLPTAGNIGLLVHDLGTAFGGVGVHQVGHLDGEFTVKPLLLGLRFHERLPKGHRPRPVNLAAVEPVNHLLHLDQRSAELACRVAQLFEHRPSVAVNWRSLALGAVVVAGADQFGASLVEIAQPLVGQQLVLRARQVADVGHELVKLL